MKASDDSFPLMCLVSGLVIAVIFAAVSEGEKFLAGMGLSTNLVTAAGTAYHYQTKKDDTPPDPPL